MSCFLAVGANQQTRCVSFLVTAPYELDALRLAQHRAQRLGVPCQTWKLERVRTAGTEKRVGALRGWLRTWWED